MKLLSIAVPSYNSEKFLADTLTSLLGYEDVEVIVVNDGSKDGTLKIANEFKEKYPDYIKVIDKENGGHGSGLNAASKIAEGLYFKCCDSDDTLDREGLNYLLDKIRQFQKEDNLPDLFLADYIAVYSNHNKETVCGLKKRFKHDIDKYVGFGDIRRLTMTDYVMIHMTFVKTEILTKNHMNLVEKTFYEDNQFVYFVLGHCNSMCYLDKPIYRYALGDAGQSVSIPNMIKNYEHDLRAFNATYREFKWSDYEKWPKAKQRFVLDDLAQMYVLAYTYVYLKHSKERRNKFKQMKKDFKAFDPILYKKVRLFKNVVIITMVPVFIRTPMTHLVTRIVSKLKGWNY